MNILVDHAETFINTELDRLIEYRNDIQARMKICEVAYESMFFPKLFGWKYKNSLSYWEDSWDCKWEETGVLIEFGCEILYAKKFGDKTVALPKTLQQRWQDWLLANGILQKDK